MFCPPWPAAVAVRLSFTVQEGFLYLRSSKIFGCTHDSIQSGVHKTHRAGYRVYDSPECCSWTPGILVVIKRERLVSRTATNLI